MFIPPPISNSLSECQNGVHCWDKLSQWARLLGLEGIYEIHNFEMSMSLVVLGWFVRED